MKHLHFIFIILCIVLVNSTAGQNNLPQNKKNDTRSAPEPNGSVSPSKVSEPNVNKPQVPKNMTNNAGSSPKPSDSASPSKVNEPNVSKPQVPQNDTNNKKNETKEQPPTKECNCENASTPSPRPPPCKENEPPSQPPVETNQGKEEENGFLNDLTTYIVYVPNEIWSSINSGIDYITNPFEYDIWDIWY